MKKLLNNIYITTQKSYLHKEGETVVIEVEGKKSGQIPIHSLLGIYCFGNVLMSPYLIGFCGERGVNVAYFTEYGRFLGRLQGRQSGNVLLRRAQYRSSDKSSLNIARSIVFAKVTSSRRTLQRHLRNHGSNDEVESAVLSLKNSLIQIKNAGSLELLRGHEGEAASRYFGVFGELISRAGGVGFQFHSRNRRPPRDPVNAMLSFIYSVAGQDVSAALQGVGLDPQVGYLHADRPGRDSLALDLLEEFRSWWLDRIVLTLINRKQVTLGGFVNELGGGVQMNDETRKALLHAYQARKQEDIRHPFLGESVKIGLVPHIQAMLLARHLRGDLEFYPPFVVQ